MSITSLITDLGIYLGHKPVLFIFNMFSKKIYMVGQFVEMQFDFLAAVLKAMISSRNFNFNTGFSTISR